MNQNLFIGNLPFDTKESELKEMLDPYGVVGIKMPKDRDTGRFRGFAFIEVKEPDRAVSELTGAEFGGRPIRIDIARPKEEKRSFVRR